MAEKIDCIVVGAGVVGLAIARALGELNLEVLVLETEELIGTGISSRNSEVIHAGIYYPPGSVKARLCLEGRRILYDYCAEHGVEYRRCGKLIVATEDDQLPQLRTIESTARANGVSDLRTIGAAEARELEPVVECAAALHSPSTGIVDSHGLMLSLQGEIERLGGSVVCRAPVQRGNVERDAVNVEAGDARDCVSLCASVVINSAGLGAQEVARRLGVPEAKIPSLHYAKGNYYSLQGRCPFTRLIYPVPEPGGLGVHLTLDLAGRARFGPDVEWINEIDYEVDPRRAERFYAAIRRYWPGLPHSSLEPAYAGIRPKLGGPGAPASDFVISGPEDHGLPRLINLFGIESPGLTASLAIGQKVAEAVRNWI